MNLKKSSGRLVIIVKGFLKLPNLHMLLKQEGPSLLGKLILMTFGELLIVFVTKVKSATPRLFNGPEVLASDLIEQN